MLLILLLLFCCCCYKIRLSHISVSHVFPPCSLSSHFQFSHVILCANLYNIIIIIYYTDGYIILYYKKYILILYKLCKIIRKKNIDTKERRNSRRGVSKINYYCWRYPHVALYNIHKCNCVKHIVLYCCT